MYVFGTDYNLPYLDVNTLVGIFFELKLVPFLSAASYCEEIPNLFVIDLDANSGTDERGNQNSTLFGMPAATKPIFRAHVSHFKGRPPKY